MQSFMQKHGEDIADNGWNILPVRPGKKVPGRWDGSEWHNLANWSSYCLAAPNDITIARWKGWPNAGVGIACGRVVGIDIDVEDAALSHRLRSLAFEVFGETPFIRIGKEPKQLLVYQVEKPFKKFTAKPIDILADGSFFVSHAIHPDTGQPYRWTDDNPADSAPDAAPIITEEQCRDYIARAAEILPLSKPRERPVEVVSSDAEGDYDTIKSALEHINADDYELWVRVGMALKRALPDAQGFELFDNWSATSQKYDAAACRRKWDFGLGSAHSLGAGTIYYEAEQAGWTREVNLDWLSSVDPAIFSKLHLPPDAKLSVVAPTKPRQVKGIPDHLYNVSGILKEIHTHMVASAPSPQPWPSLGAAICAVGAAAGRRYRSRSGLRTNISAIGVVDSGGGKDHARKWLKAAFAAADLDCFIGGERIMSGSALLASLTKHPTRLYLLDEFGHMVSSMTNGRAAGHTREVWTNLTQLATSAEGRFYGAEYANQDERPRVEIVDPHVVVYGTTVPGPLWEALGQGAKTDGSLARFLLFVTDNDYPDKSFEGKTISIPPSVVAGLRMLATGYPDKSEFEEETNLGHVQSEKESNPYTVPETEEATNMLLAYLREETALLRESDNPAHRSIIARSSEHAIKLALISAVSRDPVNPVIAHQDAEWAINLSRYCVCQMIEQSDKHAFENTVEKNHKRVMALISESGERGIKKSDITVRTQYLDKKSRDDILNALLQAGMIVSATTNGSGRPEVRFYSYDVVKEIMDDILND